MEKIYIKYENDDVRVEDLVCSSVGLTFKAEPDCEQKTTVCWHEIFRSKEFNDEFIGFERTEDGVKLNYDFIVQVGVNYTKDAPAFCCVG